MCDRHGWQRVAKGLMAFAPMLLLWGCSEEAGTGGGDDHPFAGNDQPGDTSGALGVEFCDGVDCNQLINAQLAPLYEEEGLRYIREDDLRLCRRMSLDLTDHMPSWEEVETHCLGRSAQEMADYFMSKPEYVLRGQRWWADVLMYNDGDDFSYWRFIETVDNLVGQLFRGEVAYGDFVEQVLASPYYITRFSGQDRVNKAFAIFMGRDALPVESADFEAFWRIWTVERARDEAYGADYRRPYVDTRQCAGGPGTFLCESTLLGRHAVIIPLLDDSEENRWDFERNAIDIDDLSAEQWETLRTPGRVFAGETVLWEAAVDRALSQFLGWEEGKDAFAKPPGTALPAVRDAVVAWFMETGNWRELERAIVTSGLYTATSRREDVLPDVDPDEIDPNNPPIADAIPIWALGPLKQMTAEQWLYAIEDFTGVDVGDCDHRYPEVRAGNLNDETYYHPHNYPLADEAINRPDFEFQEIARVFGGCPDRDIFHRQTATGVVLSLEAAGLIASACFDDDALDVYLFHDPETRSAVDRESREALFRQQFREALTQEPAPEDMEALMSFSDGCLENLDECPVEELPNRFCGALLRSSEFLFY